MEPDRISLKVSASRINRLTKPTLSRPTRKVWYGKAPSATRSTKPDKQQKNLDKAIAKLLKNYPPSGKKLQAAEKSSTHKRYLKE